jgi:hypothetical protein
MKVLEKYIFFPWEIAMDGETWPVVNHSARTRHKYLNSLGCFPYLHAKGRNDAQSVYSALVLLSERFHLYIKMLEPS